MTKRKIHIFWTALLATSATMPISAAVTPETQICEIDGIIYRLEPGPAATVTGHEWPSGNIVDRLELQSFIPSSSFSVYDSDIESSDGRGIPVRFIGEGAFQGCNINTLVLPSQLIEISANAFREASIGNLIFPINLRLISPGAFYGVSGIDMLNLPDALIFAGQRAFACMPHLTGIGVGPHLYLTDEALAGNSIDAIRIYSEVKPPEPDPSAFWFQGEHSDPRWTLYIPEGTYTDYRPSLADWRSNWVGANVVEMHDSPMAQTIKEATSSLNLRIKTCGHTITIDRITDVDNGKVDIFDIHGRLIESHDMTPLSLTVAPGIYVVKHGNESVKVSVR